MQLLDFTRYALWSNVLVFIGSAAVVWAAGTQISGYARAISERTGVGKAFVGFVLLGGITSLPEVAVTVTSSVLGNAPLAVNNLLGGVAMQVAILAVADVVLGRGALSSVIPKPVVLLEATFAVLLLTLVISGISVGELPLGPDAGGPAGLQVGAWATALLAAGGVSIWLVHGYEREPAWRPENGRPAPRAGESGSRDEAEQAPERGGSPSLTSVLLRTALAAAAILVAGFFLSRTGEAIAEQTGLGASFVGAVLVAISTSLPEVSTVIAAVRLRQYEMAVSDIFGTNLFDIALVFVVDAVYPGGPVLNEVGTFSVVAALLAIAVTTIYLAGLIERKDRTVLRMGWDSLAVLLVYLGGLLILYRLR